MKQVTGFPARMRFTPIPDFFFSNFLPEIDDILELKITLYVLGTLYRKKGYPRFVTPGELLADASLQQILQNPPAPPEEALRHALSAAASRGTIIRLTMTRNQMPEDLYFLNTVSERQTVTRIQNGELVLTGMENHEPKPAIAKEMPDIFEVYEQNIGMLTPIIAEELREAEKLYPAGWIRDAVKESVARNKRSWKYISVILERWATEGRDDGTHREDSEKEDKYTRGKYGHIIKW